MAGCPHQQDDGNDSHLCLHESWQPGEDAFVSDHDITERVAALAVLPDLVIVAVGIAVGLVQISMAGFVGTGGIITRCVGNMLPFR